jgi:hypothetical protein
MSTDVHEGLAGLVAANASLWAGEEAVFSRYWASPVRTPATDAVWLARQCYKELYDGVLPRLHQVEEALDSFDASDRVSLGAALHDAETEYAHFLAFASAYDLASGGGGAALDGRHLATADWRENEVLGECRRRHREEHGEIGRRAQLFTEGGYCTLYRSGAALAGSALDDAIAEACRRVYDDEWDHLLAGIAGLDDGTFSGADWDLLTELTTEQSRLRIAIRNAQFGEPLTPDEVADLQAGSLPPMPFDFERAAAAYG